MYPLSPTRGPSSTYAEHQAYRLGVAGYPGPVDRWLISNSRSPRIDFLQNHLLLDNPKYEHVICTVEPRYEVVSDIFLTLCSPNDNPNFYIPGFSKQKLIDNEPLQIYTLYLTASAAPGSRINLLLRKSPQVIIDRHCGSNQEALAPLWTRWSSTHWQSLEFQQPTQTFAKLFVEMASWEFNKDQVSPYL